MSLNIENTLYDIDQQFANKKQNEIYAIWFFIVAAPFALSYLLFWESAEAGYEASKEQRIELEKEIAADNQYLATHPEALIAKLANERKAIDAQFEEYKESNEYIKYKIEQISELFYDEKVWGEYLDSIAENAKKYNVNIELFTNKLAKNQDAFGHVLDINVVSYGSYHNVIKFINSLEQSFLVVDIHHFKIEQDEKLNNDLKISVWGITE